MADVIGAALVFYALPLLAVWAVYAAARIRRTRRDAAVLEASLAEGLMEPASLHPAIDPARCLGCGACVDACPENDVLGLVAGRAVLITPANCIGHGACRDACPFDAIALVLGTQNRGVDVPKLSPGFETNVPGLFVAGELGGMGLIRNGIEQGRQAIDSIRSLDGIGQGDRLDVVIVGAGPAGLSASLAAQEHGLRYSTFEQETLGGTVAHYPRGKIVMTAPVDLPLYGKVKLRETTKESLLALWTEVVRKTGVHIRYGTRVEAIEAGEAEFRVRTEGDTVRARAVLLAIGRRGTPRKLGIPGEQLDKVVYSLVDPEQYRERRVLVVGGGDSALEAALALIAEPGTEVLLSYRGESFSRAKPKNRQKVDAAVAEGRLEVLLQSQVRQICGETVEIETAMGDKEFANDDVIVCAGGILPTAFLESIGIEIQTRRGESA